MAYRDSTTASGTSATPSVAVPAGVQTNDIIILVCTQDGTTAVFQPADYPTGFTELFQVTLTLDGQVVAVAWKRTTGADSGSYTFGDIGVGTGLWICQAVAFSGRDTGNPPVGTQATSNAANTSPVSINATGVTALLGDDLCWISAPDVTVDLSGTGHTAPASFIEREDDELSFDNLSIATRDNVAAGATGTVTGTFTMTSGTSGWAAYLIRIPAAGGGAPSDGELASASQQGGTLWRPMLAKHNAAFLAAGPIDDVDIWPPQPMPPAFNMTPGNNYFWRRK